jgi:hypothetical protein
VIEKLEQSIVKGEIYKNDMIPLNALDVLTGHLNMAGVYFFESPPNIERLKHSLSKTLDLHSSFGGSMVRMDNKIYIYRNNVGTPFSVYRSEEACPDFNNFAPITDGSELIDADFPLRIFDGATPLNSFRITLFKDGPWALAIRNVHSLVDGAGFANFLHCWSAIYNGENGFPASVYSRENISALALGNGYKPSSKFNIFPPPNFSLGKKFLSNKMAFGATHIDIPNHIIEAMINRCKKSSHLPLTSSDILHALTWRAFALSTEFPAHEESRVYTVYDIKNVQALGIPNDFEGNSVIERNASLSFEVLRTIKLHDLSNIYRNQIKPVTELEIRKDIAFLNSEYARGNIKENGTFSNFVRGSLVDCLDGTGIFVNDIRFLEASAISFEEKTVWFETVQNLGFNVIFIYQKRNGTMSFRYVGETKTLKPFCEFLEISMRNP